MQFNTDRKELEKARREDGRLPPGQSLTLKWPVLHEGPIPAFDPKRWRFSVGGLAASPFELTWNEFQQLPRATVTADFHCVTTWGKFDNRWQGVPFRIIAEKAQPRAEARFVIVRAEGGYTTNVPLEDLMRDDVLFADQHEPEPLTPEHGGPLRLVVPHLYAWKSAKWVRGLEFVADDRAGYWERVGYHMRGDPFQEQRYREGS